MGNILRSTRYGAISSKVGRIKNTIAGIVFSDVEIFSTLELTQAVHDSLMNQAKGDAAATNAEIELPFPLDDAAVFEAVNNATVELLKKIIGREPVALALEEINALEQEVLDRPQATTVGLHRRAGALQRRAIYRSQEPKVRRRRVRVIERALGRIRPYREGEEALAQPSRRLADVDQGRAAPTGATHPIKAGCRRGGVMDGRARQRHPARPLETAPIGRFPRRHHRAVDGLRVGKRNNLCTKRQRGDEANEARARHGRLPSRERLV